MNASVTALGDRHQDAHADRGVLRFLTCGSVDDGKSTLIGRLLYDTRSLLADTLAQIEALSRRRGHPGTDYSLVTDGLEAERAQGITIDVAHRYFSTARRKFIVADAPGHEQYTRNMVTAASAADLAVLLVDARHGPVEQTRRHATLAALLGIEQIVLAVNKMDLVGWSSSRFAGIAAAFSAWAGTGAPAAARVTAVPVCAVDGGNLATRSPHSPWYDGPTLLEALESARTSAEVAEASPLRLPVQWVCRPQADSPRLHAGRIEAGVLRVGDEVTVLPAGVAARIARISVAARPRESARAGDPVMVALDPAVDVVRGDLIVPNDPRLHPPLRERRLAMTLCWLSDTPFAPAREYLLRHGASETRARVTEVTAALDVHTLRWSEGTLPPVGRNAIVRAIVDAQQAVRADRYASSRATGGVLLVDGGTGDTLAAGLLA